MRKYRYVLLSNSSGRRLECMNAPQGWDKQKINLIRDFTYFGVLKSLSVEFELIGDAYDFIQREYLSHGLNTDILFRLYKTDYEFVFEGKVNFQNFRDDRTNRRFRIDIIQSAFVEKFNNSDTIKLNLLNNISLDRTPVEPVYPRPALFRGMTLQQHSEFEGNIYEEEDNLAKVYHHGIPFQVIANDNEDVQAISSVELSENISSLYTQDNHIYVNSLNANQTVKLNLSFNVTLIRQSIFFGFEVVVKHRIILVNSNNTIASILYEKSNAMNIVSPAVNFEASYSNSVIVEPGQHIVAVCERYLGNGDTPLTQAQMEGTHELHIFYNTLAMTINIDSVAADTTHPVILPHELFSNLIAQVSGKDNAFYSEFFGRTDLGYDADGPGAYLGIIQGDLARGVPLEETQVITTFKDAFKSYDAVFNLAVRIDRDKLIIEPKDEMFSGEIIADLGEVGDLEVGPAKDFLFNSVKAGYPPIDYEAVNGRTEFNTEVQYTNSLRPAKKELDIRSVYRGDARGIEETRRLAIRTTGTKDTQYDNKIFLIDLIREGSQLITRRKEGILHTDGIFNADTAYNLRIFPGQNLLRWQRYLSIPLHRMDKVYFFQSKEKNSGATVVTELGQSVDGEDLTLLGSPFFMAEEKHFKGPLTMDALGGILNNPLGILRYTHKGETFFDYVLEVDSETENKGTTYRVLSTRPSPVKRDAEQETADAILYDNDKGAVLDYGGGAILYQ